MADFEAWRAFNESGQQGLDALDRRRRFCIRDEFGRVLPINPDCTYNFVKED